MKTAALLLLALLAAGGCARTENDLQYQLEQCRTERDRLRLSLDEESARTAAITERYTVDSATWEADRAALSALRQRAQELERLNAQLVDTVEKRASQPLSPPKVPASPLPEELDRKLLDFARRYETRATYVRGRGGVSFAGDRLFDPGSDAVRNDAAPMIGDLAAIASRGLGDGYDLVIVGHTDDAAITRSDTRDKHPTNWHLSVHRAIAFKDLLVSAGVAEERLGVSGYGATRPASTDRAANRRIEVFFVRRGVVGSFDPLR